MFKSRSEQFSEDFVNEDDDMPRLATVDAVDVVQERFKESSFKQYL